jgi:hypothetical protein
MMSCATRGRRVAHHASVKAAVVSSIVALSTAACGDEGGMGAFARSESGRFAYHVRADQEIDARVFERLEWHAALVDRALELAGERPAHLDYFKYRDLEDLQQHSPCGSEAGGCARPRSHGTVEVHSPLSVDEHELVHTYGFVLGAPPKFLSEGLAMSLSCYPGVESFVQWPMSPGWLSLSWREALFPDATEEQPQYSVFTTWLIDRFGAGPFKRFYGSLARSAGATEVAASFRAVFGRELDASFREFQSDPARRGCIPLTACLADEATGELALTTAVEDFRTGIPVPATGLAVSLVSGDAPVVRACTKTAALAAFHGYWPVLLETDALFLPARSGYVVAARNPRLVPGVGDTRSVLRVTPTPSTLASDCAEQPTIVLPSALAGAVVWGPPDLTFRVGTEQEELGTSMVRIGDTEDAGVAVEVCGTCQSGLLSQCALVPGIFSAEGPAAPWIRVRWSAPQSSVTILGLRWRHLL